METSLLWLVLLFMASLLTALTWVGLRFFCTSAGPMPHPSPAARTRWCLQRYRLPQLRGVFRLSAILAPLKSRVAIWVATTMMLVGFTVTLTLTLAKYIDPPPMTGEDMGPTDSVGGILREETLVPPQPLPPSLFFGTESFDLEHADRDWSKLDAGFKNTVLQLFGRMESRGYQMALLEGFRSAERQGMLANKGPSVTHARVGQSRHQYGLAADVAPMRQGRLVISERDPWAAAAYQALGEEAGKLGLTWGGSWTFRDLGHVENAARISHLTQPPTP